MGVERKLAVSGLNVRIVRKENRDYPALFQAIFRIKKPIKVYSNDHLILTSFERSGRDAVPYIGAIGRFTDIPDDAEWLDTESLDVADDERVASIVIPESLKPNYEAFYCALFPGEHILAFESFSESQRLPERHVLKWFEQVVKSRQILERFGPIEADIVPDYTVIERILQSETLRELEIRIKRTNPDDYTAEQFAAAEERLRRLNAKEERIEYTADRGEFLELDEYTEALARVGAENGQVNGRLRDDGIMKRVSTAEQPLQEQEKFDPDVTPPLVMFRALALKVLGSVLRNRAG